jgi:hypothetical protein
MVPPVLSLLFARVVCAAIRVGGLLGGMLFDGWMDGWMDGEGMVCSGSVNVDGANAKVLTEQTDQ